MADIETRELDIKAAIEGLQDIRSEFNALKVILKEVNKFGLDGSPTVYNASFETTKQWLRDNFKVLTGKDLPADFDL